MEAGLEGAGYALADVSKVIVTHAHIDHYGLAGRVMELTGADLSMHAMTDLDCEKYRHPDTSRSRRKDTYADHGIPEDEQRRPRRPPHPLAALSAFGGGGVHPVARRRADRDRR